MKLLTVFILSLFLFTSCGDEKENNESITGELSPEVMAIVNDADTFEALVRSDRILRRSSIPDREGITFEMMRIKGLIMHLDRRPDDARALEQLRLSLLNFQSFNLSERDAPRIFDLTNRMSKMYIRFAKGMNVDPGNFTFTLFQYDLAQLRAPFGVHNVRSSAWQEAVEQLDRYVVTARGDAHSWLISPRFDFTNTTNSGIRLRHSFNIGRNNRENDFNLQQIKRDVFKVMYSETFKKGDPRSVDDWKQLDLGTLPLGQDFHEVDTGFLSFNKFDGKKITIAFVYNNDTKKHGRHYPSWNLLRFDVMGTSDNFTYRPYSDGLRRATSSYTWEANKLKNTAMDNFTQEVVAGEPGSFGVKEFRGKFYIRVNGQDRVGIVDLYTNVFDLQGMKKPVFQVTHASNFYPVEKHSLKLLKILVAENNEDVDDWKTLNWQELELNTGNIGSGYEAVKSDWLTIPANLAGKKVSFAFRWEGQGADAPLWDIHAFSIGELDE